MCVAALPGRAQEGSSTRFAFADTTLLRDTLGLRFERLFPLSDSLQVLPDTLRAISIRYQLGLERLVQLADSLGMPVDSVGPVLERERFNPLAAGVARRTGFTYSSSYTIGQTQSAWRNSGDYEFQAGPLFLRSTTTVQMDRYRAGSGTSLHQTRSSATELGWRLSPEFSLGGRVNLERFNSRQATASVGETKNEYQLSLRSRQKPLPGLSSTINFFSGLLDLRNAALEKRGLSGNLNTRIRYTPGSWLSQEVSASVDGNLARARRSELAGTQRTRDHSENVRGTLSLFQGSPVGFMSNFGFRHVQVENPDDSGQILRVLSDNASVDGTLRLRRDNDRYLDLRHNRGVTKQATVVGASARTTRHDDGFTANARYLLRGWALDARFQNAFGNSEFPNRSGTGAYGEFRHTRSLDGTLSRQLTSRLTAKLSANIGLTSFRYFQIGEYGATLPTSRDQWRQSWKAEGNYARSATFNTAMALEVSKNRDIRIPSVSSGSSEDSRSYRAEWRWSYRLLPGLTATQRNTITADYTEYPFRPEDSRLALDYGSVTTMNAVMSRRLTINVTHYSRENPGGNYTLFPDGLYYFSRADETRNSSLAVSIGYTPSSALALTFEPSYFAADRTGTVDRAEVPQRRDRTLNFAGGAAINWPISRKGTLRGDIRRTYRAERVTTYSAGVPQPSPRSERDFWNGTLQLSWQL